MTTQRSKILVKETLFQGSSASSGDKLLLKYCNRIVHDSMKRSRPIGASFIEGYDEDVAENPEVAKRTNSKNYKRSKLCFTSYKRGEEEPEVDG
jgi:hypothetical protein